jgi:hypothetical protein
MFTAGAGQDHLATPQLKAIRRAQTGFEPLTLAFA